MILRERIDNDLKVLLKEKRYLHTLGVENVARDLGSYFHQDIEKLSIAALLHDSGKYLGRNEQAAFIRDNRIDVTEDDLMAEGTMHAKISGYIAREKYGITDNEILNAVLYHTTGRPGMSQFEKLIFVSDYLDPGRGLPGRDDLLRMVKNNLVKGALEICKQKISFVVNNGRYLHPMAVGFYNELLLGPDH